MVTELLLLFMFLCFVLPSREAIIAKKGCQSKCGNITIPYPFGIGSGCSFDSWADILCNSSFNPPKPTLHRYGYEVVDFLQNEVRVKNHIFTGCYDRSGMLIYGSSFTSAVGLDNSSYTLSAQNKFTVIGCGMVGTVAAYGIGGNPPGHKFSTGCVSICDEKGQGSCQMLIPKGSKQYKAYVDPLNSHFTNLKSSIRCGSAFVADRDYKVSNITSLRDITTVFSFAVGNSACKDAQQDATTYACKGNSECSDLEEHTGYVCNCQKGYQGNPYLADGCEDVDECADIENNPCKGKCINTIGSYNCTCPEGKKDGSGCTGKDERFPTLPLVSGVGLSLLFLPCCIYFISKRRRQYLKQKYFRKNGGLLLDQYSYLHGRFTLFNSDELMLATDNYSETRIIGQGGSGTVYKGTLNGDEVAVKKLKPFSTARQIEQFLNEIIILSQLNHRYIVKLLGCCLETEVPMLVYEFVQNGALSDHIHKQDGVSSISWEDRLGIALGIAAALLYAHYDYRERVIHRDVKSANILLDETYKPKLSDFGASRLFCQEESKIITIVEGTLGYVDPEYICSGYLTEKSDVYSFGVVLAELLTGEKSVLSSYERTGINQSLAQYFVSAMEKNCLSQILDEKIVDEVNMEQIYAVAEVVVSCLHHEGRERPSMQEVANQLQAIRNLDRSLPSTRKKSRFGIKRSNRPTATSARTKLSSYLPVRFKANWMRW